MALSCFDVTQLVFLLCLFIYSTYCGNIAQSSTTPWPELGTNKRGSTQSNIPIRQVSTAAPKRDFVSNASAWNKPLNFQLSQSSSVSQEPYQSSIRDFAPTPKGNSPKSSTPNPSGASTTYSNGNIGQSYAKDETRRGSGHMNSRDYVNPNIKLSYPTPNLNAINKSSSPTVRPTNSGTLRQTLPTQPQSTLRDYVNPNSQISYSNIVSNHNNNKIGMKPTETSSIQSTAASPPTGQNSKPIKNSNLPTTPLPNDKSKEDNELREFAENLLRTDLNNAFKYVTVNYQGMTRSNSKNDEAPQPFLNIESAVYKIPSVEKLMLLYNNYIIESNQNEVYTAQERIEESNFLDTILPTPVMQHTRNFLISKGKISKDPKDFKDLLRTIWFNMYSRGGGKIGSSGFEHVFLSEIKNDEISGLHNWIYFNEEEKKSIANYLGYMKKLEFEKGAIVKYHFNFAQKDKPVGSMFIGTSPEFELALYSTCFLMRADDVCPLRLGGKNFIIRTYTYRYRGKNMIGSAFPEI